MLSLRSKGTASSSEYGWHLPFASPYVSNVFRNSSCLTSERERGEVCISWRGYSSKWNCTGSRTGIRDACSIMWRAVDGLCVYFFSCTFLHVCPRAFSVNILRVRAVRAHSVCLQFVLEFRVRVLRAGSACGFCVQFLRAGSACSFCVQLRSAVLPADSSFPAVLCGR